MANQYIIVQGELAVVVKSYTEMNGACEVLPGNVEKVISGPKGLYLKPKRMKFVGNYTIIEQREQGS